MNVSACTSGSLPHRDLVCLPHGVVTILGGVLAQRREHYAVLQRHATEFERLEELRNGLLALDNKRSAGRRRLQRCEVRDARSRSVGIAVFFFRLMAQSMMGSHCLCGSEGGYPVDEYKVCYEVAMKMRRKVRLKVVYQRQSSCT